ncbi:hypothetical protein ACGC1H_002298 [Rhizoctonia solani]|uniref:F-box domain-containing protein n=1 Tax=Rhizoctonia solani TaxID=456999 RepID=A0A8H3GHB0_9AGAM|nr:unnamed protein product [Rhizoctonia solani]
MRLNDLPFDIVSLILWLLPRRHLSTVSRVCRTWRNAILPLLFKAIYLSKNYPNAFIRQILDETNDTIPQSTKPKLSNYVQRLSIHWRMNKQELEDFSLALQKLENLRHITWEVAPFPWMGWDNTIGLLHSKSPGLQSLRLIVDQDADAIGFNIGDENLAFQTDVAGLEPGDSDKTVVLTNLSKLSIEFRTPSSKRPVRVPQEIVSLIRSARNLESLRLDFGRLETNWSSSRISWGAADIFTFLPSDYFPNLRSIRIRSSNLAKLGVFGGPELCRFLENHNHLEELVISPIRRVGVPANVGTTVPQVVERLMPSIRRFTGTTPSVNALLGSRLARQLEALELFVYPRDSLETGVSELPCLNELRLRISYPGRNREWKTIWDVLGNLASRTTALRELSIETYGLCTADELPSLLHALSRLPNLLQLIIIYREDYLLPGRDIPSFSQDIRDRIARDFPLLRVIVTQSLL